MRKRVLCGSSTEFEGHGDGSCNTPGIQYTDHYFYDGVRRIQEVRTVGGDPSQITGGLSEDIVEDCLEGGLGCPGATYLNNQFIYGLGYVDEMIAQVPHENSGIPVLIFQDANYNVIGLMDWSDY